jgi:signal transduction histidine kinase
VAPPPAALVADATLALAPQLAGPAGGAHVHELRSSRARLVSAADSERQRIQRDLHDGAQQRLVSLLLNIKLARRVDQTAAAELLDTVETELAAALAELRALAAGVLPPVLADHGLDAAVEELAFRSPIPVAIEQMPDRRLPRQVEGAAYFVIAEALANVAKHAGASGASVRVTRMGASARIEIRDDGAGSADPARGSGLRGLADRVGALGGRLLCESRPGQGTRLTAEIPCGP